ncbi:hypothetical protein [Polaribacter glomeratus]|nr:hypothetical protein [Polaribacter glomeratus]TXD64195.1 hypothetical protein ESX12_15905 [Polaribacter glomeratus]
MEYESVRFAPQNYIDMKKIIEKTVDLNLVGVNGNAYAIMSVFRKQARKEGWTSEEIEAVLDEAKTSDYNYLLATIENHCDPKDIEL